MDNQKEKQLIEATQQFLTNFTSKNINGSLIELYFSYTSITSDFPVEFQTISSNIHGLMKFMAQLGKIDKMPEDQPKKRGRKSAPTR